MVLAICLLGVGLVLILAEVVFPSFGLLSILATACIVGAIVSAFADSSTTGVQFLVATAVLVPGTILAGLKLLPLTPMGKHMVVRGLTFESRAATDERDLRLVGQEGVVESELRPAGFARVGGRRVDVVSRGESIEPGARVRVAEVRGNRVVVVRVADDAAMKESEA